MRSLLGDEAGRRPDWLESRLLRTREVALLFRVSRHSVSQWARSGKLPFIVTPGGHRRYRARDVRTLYETAASRRSRHRETG